MQYSCMVWSMTVFDALAYPFMQRALAAGVLVGVMTSLLGVLVVLRRSAFFGDAIAHAALTGVAIGVLTGWNPLLAAVGVGIGIAMSLQVMERRSRLALDTVLGFVLPFLSGRGRVAAQPDARLSTGTGQFSVWQHSHGQP